ncbi:MAG: PaaI family thioesterase [Proteobacteria bacterium]|nr:MAG: PaaI family thioesterase [Pseudomonadota bacterium]
MSGLPESPVAAHKLLGKRPPAAELIGFEIPEAANGRAVVTLDVGPQHANPMGTVHGGILCDIADAAMGFAFASTLAPEESFTTVELKINFLRPVRQARLRAEGGVVARGKTVGYVESSVFDENGKLIAKANSTCLVLSGEKAVGR